LKTNATLQQNQRQTDTVTKHQRRPVVWPSMLSLAALEDDPDYQEFATMFNNGGDF
jgi:hypothetical protein